MISSLLFSFSLLLGTLLFLLKKGKGKVKTVFKLSDFISDLDRLLFVNTYTHRKAVREMKQARKETIIEPNETEYNRDTKGRFAPKETDNEASNVKYVRRREDGTYEILQNIKAS